MKCNYVLCKKTFKPTRINHRFCYKQHSNLQNKIRICFNCKKYCFGYLCKDCRKKKGSRVTALRKYRKKKEI